MSKIECAQDVAKKGGELLTYKEARYAVIRLAGGQRISIAIDRNMVELRRSYGIFDRLMKANPIALLDLDEMYDDAQDDTQTPLDGAAVLDILIERVSSCRSRGDVIVKASTGALDPFRTDGSSQPPDRFAAAMITKGVGKELANQIRQGQELSSEAKWKLIDYLEHLVVPVMLVDRFGKVRTANTKAQALFQKNLSKIVGFNGGNVFECAHAKRPEGCGATIHCSGCTIRRTVMDTFSSGKSNLGVPAYVDAASHRKIDMLISTERAGDVVLLRIDRFGGNTTPPK
jgi:hypothetical protein